MYIQSLVRRTYSHGNSFDLHGSLRGVVPWPVYLFRLSSAPVLFADRNSVSLPTSQISDIKLAQGYRESLLLGVIPGVDVIRQKNISRVVYSVNLIQIKAVKKTRRRTSMSLPSRFGCIYLDLSSRAGQLTVSRGHEDWVAQATDIKLSLFCLWW